MTRTARILPIVLAVVALTYCAVFATEPPPAITSLDIRHCLTRQTVFFEGNRSFYFYSKGWHAPDDSGQFARISPESEAELAEMLSEPTLLEALELGTVDTVICLQEQPWVTICLEQKQNCAQYFMPGEIPDPIRELLTLVDELGSRHFPGQYVPFLVESP